MFLLLTALIFIFVCFSIWSRYLEKYRDIEKLPGPSAFTLIREAIRKKDKEELLKSFIALTETYGPLVKIWIKPFKPTLIIADTNYLERILHDHLNKTRSYTYLYPLMGHCLVNSPAKIWKYQRKATNPAFSAKVLEEVIPAINYHGNILLDILRNLDNKMSVNIAPIITMFALDVTCGTNFQITKNLCYEEALSGFLTIVMKRANSLAIQNDFIFKLTPTYKEQEKYIKILKTFSMDVFKEQKANLNTGGDNKLCSIMDILFTKSLLSQGEYLNQIDFFIAAANHTVSSSLCFAVFEIARNKDIQEKILEESIQILGNDKEAVPSVSELQQLKYLECVIKEILRHYPVAPFLERFIKEDVTIESLKIPKGTDVIISVYHLHHTEKYFPRPYEFDPERFSPENIDKIQPNTFIPFSIGPRNCIGRHLGMLEMKMVLSKLIRNFEFHSVEPNHKLRLEVEFSLRSANGILVTFTERN